ncbi:MAG: ATPase, T2SS/T4P/T4SS family [Patescibacteria group bacterium]|jgi:twitching motility protein PilT
MPGLLDTTTELRLTKLLASVAEYKASDLHLTVANPPSLRIAGRIQPLTSEPLLTNDFIITVVQALLSDQQWEQFQLKKDILVTLTFKGKTRYKFHAYAQQGNISASFRLIPAVVQPLTRWTIHDAVKQCVSIKQGLIVVAGTYGTGKSTLVSGMVEEYNQTLAAHIMTFEQPIEYRFTDNKSIIEQVEVGTDVSDMPSALSRLYQEDIDIVTVNVPIDASVVRTVLQIVQSGKLVILEVLSPNVASALSSIVNCFRMDEQASIREVLSNQLEAVIALKQTNVGGQVTIACEVLRKNAATITVIKKDSFDKIGMLIESGRNDGMITFDQSLT